MGIMSAYQMPYPLLTLIGLPLVGTLCCLLSPRHRPALATVIATVFAAAELAWLIMLWLTATSRASGFAYAAQYEWLPEFGLQFDLRLDGLNFYPLCVATLVLLVSLVVSRDENPDRQQRLFATAPRQLSATLLLLQGSLAAVFLSLDVVLFAALCQLTLIILFFLLGADADTDPDGGKQRRAMAVRFALFNLVGTSSLLFGGLILKSRAALSGLSGSALDLQGMSMPFELEAWVLVSFFICFAIQMPLVPFHGWFADVCAAAPRWTSILIVGSWSVVGVYGIIRFCLPLFPQAVALFAGAAAVAAVLSALYGGLLALVQHENRRRIAWACISGNGILLLGICSSTLQGVHGSIAHLSSHGLSRAALLLLAVILAERAGSRRGTDIGGLEEGEGRSVAAGFRRIPLLASCWLIATLAFIGFPGSAGFPGHLLIFSGAISSGQTLAAAGVIVGFAITSFALMAMFHRLCADAAAAASAAVDLRRHYALALLPALALLLWAGLFPGTLLFEGTEQIAERAGALVRDCLPNLSPDISPDLSFGPAQQSASSVTALEGGS